MLLQNKLCAKVYSVIRWSVVMKISVKVAGTVKVNEIHNFTKS